MKPEQLALMMHRALMEAVQAGVKFTPTQPLYGVPVG